MNISYSSKGLVLELDSLEADVTLNALKFAAYDARFDSAEYVLRYGAEQSEVKQIYDSLRSKLRQ